MLKFTSKKPKKANKFGAKKTTIDHIVFDSKKEALQYMAYKAMEKKGEINNLVIQPAYTHNVNGKTCFTYKADFRFYDTRLQRERIIDVKGYKKGSAYDVFRLKKKCIEAEYHIVIEEV